MLMYHMAKAILVTAYPVIILIWLFGEHDLPQATVGFVPEVLANQHLQSWSMYRPMTSMSMLCVSFATGMYCLSKCPVLGCLWVSDFTHLHIAVCLF